MSATRTGTPAWAVERGGIAGNMCVPAPVGGTDVCGVCHGWARPGYPVCFACRLTMSAVARPCRRVSVVSLYRPDTPMHRLLRGYKDGGRGGADHLAGLLARHLWEHGAEIAPAGWDALVVVPSTSGRPAPHPLEQVLGATFLAGQVWSGLLTAGPEAVDHRRAHDRAFRISPEVAVEELRGARLVVLDDTWTTGARAQSAASALESAGASVEAIVVVGRVISPVAGAPTGRWWGRHAGPPDQEKPDQEKPDQEKRASSPIRRPEL